jgi:hypothetical protein
MSDQSWGDYVHPDLRNGGDMQEHVAGTSPDTDGPAMKQGDDPADFTVSQVVAYLKTDIDGRERRRVLNAEKKGQARKGVIGDDA